MASTEYPAQAIELQNISKAFGSGPPVVHDVDLVVQPGEFMSLLGPSGCGKSTLLRIIAGLIPQDAGMVRIGGQSVDTLSPRDRNVAMVFQNYALYPHMSVLDNIAMPLVMRRLGLLRRQPWIGALFPGQRAALRAIHDEVRQLAATLQLDALLERRPGQLSGGQRQRVALARAMVRHPAAFLMDEPLSNLDAKLRIEVRDELAALHARLGATFVYVTHDQTEAMTLSSRVAVMSAGRIVQVGSPRELYEQPATLEVARFVGTPRINVLPADALAGVQSRVRCWGLRPEHLTLAGGARCDASSELTAQVGRIEHHGPEAIAYLHCSLVPDEALCMRMPSHHGDSLPRTGDTLQVRFRHEHLLAFDDQGLRIG